MNAGNINLDILEETLFPKPVNGGGKFVAGDTYLVAYLKTRDEENHTGVVVFGTREGDTADFIDLGGEVVDVVFLTADNNLRIARGREHQHQKHGQDTIYLLHSVYYSIL